MKSSIVASVSFAMLLCCSLAHAQSPYRDSRPEPTEGRLTLAGGYKVLFGIEQAAAYQSSEITYTRGSNSYTTKSNGMALIGGNLTTGFSLDILAAGHLSLGGKFYYDTSTSENETEFGTSKGASSEEWAIEPRVGYYTPVGHRVALWLRSGINVWNRKVTEPTSSTAEITNTSELKSFVFSAALLVFVTRGLALNVNSTGTTLIGSDFSTSGYASQNGLPSMTASGQAYTLAAGLTGAL